MRTQNPIIATMFFITCGLWAQTMAEKNKDAIEHVTIESNYTKNLINEKESKRMKNLFDFTVKGTSGENVSLNEYKGKVIVVVNTATKCGLTPQYDGLQKMYGEYADKGFAVLDFPCNQFLNQAPGSEEEINEFCALNYGTKFPRFAKIDVNGANADPLFIWLKEQRPTDIGNDATATFENKVKQFTPNIEPSDIKWNFGKFLIDRNGNVVARFSPALPPEQMKEHIEKLLQH